MPRGWHIPVMVTDSGPTGGRDEAPTPGEERPQPVSASPDELARRAYEAIADDERLRGGLTDAGYSALLSWCAARALALASTSSAADVDGLARALRRAMRALVEAAETGELTALEGIDQAIVGPAAGAAAAAALSAAPDRPDARARAIARALAGD